MPNRHIQEVIDNQTRQLNITKQDCIRKYGSTVGMKHSSPYYNETSKNFMCLAYWDNILCWPHTPAGELAVLRCPSYIAGFKTTHNATRKCTDYGSWYTNKTTNDHWADYTACMDGRIVTIFTDINKTDISQNSEKIVPVIKLISQTGYTVSLIVLVIAFLILLLIRKLHCARNILHMNLFASFILRSFFVILKDILFVDGTGFWNDFYVLNGELYFKTDFETNNYKCKLLTTCVQYFTIANYSWIFMEGLYLNNLIFRAPFADSSRNLVHYICFGWGMPLIVVIPWVIARIYVDDTLCWTTNESLLAFLIIAVPIILSVLINFVLFIIISLVLYTKLRSPMNESIRRYKKWAKSTLVLVPLYGVHYAVLLIFYFIGQTDIWLVCDTLFGSFQGFFVAVLFCFANGEVKTELKPLIYKWLTYFAKHRILRVCFPCRHNFLRSAVGRHSVCTTMSSTSTYANTIGNRNNTTKWEMLQKEKASSIPDKFGKTKNHVGNGKPVDIGLDSLSNNFEPSTPTGNEYEETSLCVERSNNTKKYDSQIGEEEVCLFRQS